MGVFWLLFIYMFLIASLFHNSGNSKNKRKMETIWIGLGPFLILALRSPTCGIDLINETGSGNGYYGNFSIIAKSSWSEIFTPSFFNNNYEIGFLIYNKLVSYISDNPQFFLAFTAIICVGCVGYVIYKYSSNIFLSFIIYICLGQYIFSFSGLRQAIAISLSLLGLSFILERKNWHFFILLLLAISFHTTAIILFAAWPLCRKEMKTSTLIFLLLLVIVSIPAMKLLLSLVLSIIGLYSLEAITEGQSITMFLVYYTLLAISIIIKPNYKGNQYKDKLFCIYRWMILFAVFGQSLGFIDSGYLTRIGYYFSIYFCLYLPELFYGLNREFQKVIYPLIVLLFVAFFYLTTSDGYLDVVPYSFYWEYRG